MPSVFSVVQEGNGGSEMPGIPFRLLIEETKKAENLNAPESAK
jgi:hypothetical protein